ncbi:hypothetical protein MRB53_035072 [Persea americana]|uniref:Uncharacterized protein n=1 Tax=Persea americana TaxID=3435 RepID=A0ACC2K3N5_PERAE|nr:hypothetical protein MRB53_035072 [Persea americana]
MPCVEVDQSKKFCSQYLHCEGWEIFDRAFIIEERAQSWLYRGAEILVEPAYIAVFFEDQVVADPRSACELPANQPFVFRDASKVPINLGLVLMSKPEPFLRRVVRSALHFLGDIVKGRQNK